MHSRKSACMLCVTEVQMHCFSTFHSSLSVKQNHVLTAELDCMKKHCAVSIAVVTLIL